MVRFFLVFSKIMTVICFTKVLRDFTVPLISQLILSYISSLLFFPRSSVDILRPLTDYRRTKNRFNDRDAGINLISHCQKKLYIYNSLAIGF